MYDFRIAAIIPTFNRKSLLIECLLAISRQTFKPTTVYICDNKSTDGTKEYLVDNGFFNKIVNGINFKYLEMPVNGGGAMGFSIGMETAYKEGIYNAFWMMDDDGLPKEDCLEHLVAWLNKKDYISPIVYSREDHTKLAGPIKGVDDPEILTAIYGSGPLYYGYCNPFNGSLFSKKLVDIVGFPKKELFIYGDEMNYHQRCKMAGFNPAAVCSAIHYHPPFKSVGLETFMGVVAFRPNKLTTYCNWRNSAYNKKILFKKRPVLSAMKLVYNYIIYTFFFLFIHPSLKWLRHYNKAFFDGLFERWGKQYLYIDKKL